MVISAFRKLGGFTLIELLVVVAIAIIVAQTAIPGFSGLVKDNQSAARINELHHALAIARSEAIRQNIPVVLCSTSDGLSCNESGIHWQTGWMVFEDINGNGALDPDSTEQVLRLFGNGPEGQTLSFVPSRVIYEGMGIAIEGVGSTYVICDDRGAAYAKGLIINAIGRLRLAVDKDRNGIVEDAHGRDIVCS